MTSPWRPISSVPQAPPLLVKYEFTNSQYKVFLTDLTYVWAETLERREIIKKALNLDTSIDPSEDSGQFRLLLRKLQDALEGHEGSYLSLSRGIKSDELVLHTVTKLPPPWEPLKWPIHLACANAELLTTELLLPCLSQQFMANAQVESLLHILKEKEHVLNKLADKINSDGADFADLFPGALGARVGMKLSREQAGKFVKGLSVFDETEWRGTVSTSLISTANLSDIVPQVFAAHPTESLAINRGAVRRDWMSQLTEDSPKIFSFAPRSDQPELLNSTTRCQAEKALGDDFQKQEIPTRVKTPNPGREGKPALGIVGRSIPKQQPVPSDHDSTTTDGSDLELNSPKREAFARRIGPVENPAPVGRSISEQEPVPSDQDSTTADESDLEVNIPKRKAFARRIGPVEKPARAPDSGRSLNAVADSDGLTNLTSAPTATRPRTLGETETGDVYRDTSKPELAEAVHKPKGIFGKIGGRAKREKETEVQDPPAAVKANITEDNNTIGYVNQGGRQLTRPPPATVNSRTIFQPQSPPPPPPSPRETSQERANKKREELKRQLESKSNANVKKKRKF